MPASRDPDVAFNVLPLEVKVRIASILRTNYCGVPARGPYWLGSCPSEPVTGLIAEWLVKA